MTPPRRKTAPDSFTPETNTGMDSKYIHRDSCAELHAIQRMRSEHWASVSVATARIATRVSQRMRPSQIQEEYSHLQKRLPVRLNLT